MAETIAAIAAAASSAYAAVVGTVAAPLVAALGEGAAIAVATATVNFGISTAISFGVNALARQGIPDAEFASSNRKQAIPDRLSGYGRARLGGAFMLWEAQGSRAYNVLALHDGQVDGFENIYLNDDVVTVLGSGFVQAGTDGRYGRNSDLVQIDTRLGLPTETRYDQIPDFSIWPAEARGDGIASLMMIAKSSSQEFYLRDFPNGLPLPSVVTRMQICYDARLGSRDNPAAWIWTQNPVWQLLDYMTNPQTGMRLEYEQYFEPNIASWITAANVCDEAVPLAAGGTIARYTGDGTYLHSTSPADVMGTILACMDGWIAQDSGGVFVIEAGEYTAPTVTITDAHIVSMDRQFYLEDERAVNELVISYTSAAYDYTEVEALPWRDEADILDRNGSVRSQRMSLPWVSTNSQARRLAKIAMARATSPIRGTITTDLYGLKAFGQRRIRIQAPADSVVMADIVVDVVNVTLNSDFTVTIPFVASSPDSYEWDAATEENSQPVIPKPVPTDIDTPVLLSAVYDSGNNRIEITVQGPVDEAYEYQLAWNAQDGDPPQQIEYPVAVASGSNWIVYSTPTVPTGELIDVSVAFITSNGAVGEYSNTITVSTGATGIYGSLMGMEAADTLSASGAYSASIDGSLVSTEDDDTVSSAASVGGITGAATITEADDSVSGAGEVYDPAAAAYFAAMSVQPDATRKGLINALIVGLKADGVWSKLDLFYLLALGTQQAANLNAKTPASFALTPNGGMTFTTDRGYQGNGSTGYLSTGFNPTTAPTPNWTQNSASLFAYVSVATSNTASTESSWGNSASDILLRPWTGASAMTGRVNSGTLTFTGAAIASRLGSRCISRTGATTTNAQLNGAAYAGTVATASAAPGSAVAEIFRLAGSTYSGNDRVACAALGGGLSGAEMTALHTRTLTFLTAIGAN